LPLPTAADTAEAEIVATFHSEWSLSGQGSPLLSIVFVDKNFEHRYLYPEFLLFQRLFQRHGNMLPPRQLLRIAVGHDRY
jgi:hypothetical protein